MPKIKLHTLDGKLIATVDTLDRANLRGLCARLLQRSGLTQKAFGEGCNPPLLQPHVSAAISSNDSRWDYAREAIVRAYCQESIRSATVWTTAPPDHLPR